MCFWDQEGACSLHFWHVYLVFLILAFMLGQYMVPLALACCILVTPWWAKCKTESVHFLNPLGINKWWSNKAMLLWADNQSWTVERSCSSGSKSFLDLGKTEKMVFNSAWYCWSDWQALMVSSCVRTGSQWVLFILFNAYILLMIFV